MKLRVDEEVEGVKGLYNESILKSMSSSPKTFRGIYPPLYDRNRFNIPLMSYWERILLYTAFSYCSVF